MGSSSSKSSSKFLPVTPSPVNAVQPEGNAAEAITPEVADIIRDKLVDLYLEDGDDSVVFQDFRIIEANTHEDQPDRIMVKVSVVVGEYETNEHEVEFEATYNPQDRSVIADKSCFY
jgi:hypothetical protein